MTGEDDRTVGAPSQGAIFVSGASWREKLSVRRWDRLSQFILLLSLVFLCKQAMLVVIHPPFTGHDEVAHFNYIATVATEHRVPTLQEDQIPDYFYRYCQYILDWSPCEPDNPRWLNEPFRFADWGGGRILAAGEQYVGNHPPLYYLLMAPIYLVSEGASVETQQYLIRAGTIPIALLTVLLAFWTVRALFPRDRFLAITVPTVVAFQTQVSYEGAMVNNDALTVALCSAVIYLVVVGARDRFTERQSLLLGFVLGLSVLTKSTSLTLIPVIAFAMVASIGWRRPGHWIRSGAISGAMAAILVAPWYIHLWRTYGNLDALPQIQEMQEPWNRPAGRWTEMLSNDRFHWRRWSETWGEFGWRRVHLPDWMLWLIGVPALIGVLGLGVYCWHLFNRRTDEGSELVRPSRWQNISLLALFLTVVVSYLAIVQFGTEFILTQARYFFPAINAATILVLLGIKTVTPVGWRPWVQGGVVLGVFVLTPVIYTQYVIPYWYLTDWSET